MALTHDEIKQVLLDSGCRSNFVMKKITEFMLPELKEPIYLHGDHLAAQLLIRPAYEVFVADLDSLEGVHHKSSYFFNNDMTRFPKKQHKGLNEIHYGMPFKFDDSKAVERFIQKIIAINKGE
ncbi:hypothetical protein [Shewanella gelidii]|uniref:Uncharacterized protein n=1 Tax=Shewanella gelidii TaxID=1642821 RepID=A0A917JJ35_9GAMM|nr:hypothetical protein [Shewanella gelidii]MCL1096880.1 hypothetical protein [Shewanella gelidii]GGI70847.1 hypothetical protein GCM10009332_05210 [Shewanella gelidii]